MNVRQIMEDVIKHVLMRLAHFIVNVIQDILLMLMVLAVLVNYEHTCNNTYHFIYKIIIFVDINECSSNIDGCDHNCHNTMGSYYCTCNTGYRLDSNMRSCHGNLINHQLIENLNLCTLL